MGFEARRPRYWSAISLHSVSRGRESAFAFSCPLASPIRPKPSPRSAEAAFASRCAREELGSLALRSLGFDPSCPARGRSACRSARPEGLAPLPFRAIPACAGTAVFCTPRWKGCRFHRDRRTGLSVSIPHGPLRTLSIRNRGCSKLSNTSFLPI